MAAIRWILLTMQLTQSSESSSLSEWRTLLNEIYCNRKLLSFRKGDPLPMKPDDIWIVYQGIVKINTVHASGSETILGLACPHMLFGRSLTQVDPYEAIALTDVKLLRLHQEELEKSPRLTQNLFRELKRRMEQTEALLAMAGCRRVKDRLRQLILLLHQEFGQVTSTGIQLKVKLTHQQLASMIGSSRVTVTRLLSELKAEGVCL